MKNTVAPEVTKRFDELKSKIAGQMEIEPGSKHLVVVKTGTMTPEESVLFRRLWQEMFNTGMIMLTVDNPEKDVKVLEMAKETE